METSTGELIGKLMNLSNKLDTEMRFDESNLVLEVVAYMHAMTTRADNLRHPSYTDTRSQLNNVVRFITGTNHEDIVTRLQGQRTNSVLCDEAADEIERLRADRDKWAELAKMYSASHRKLHGLEKAWDNE